MTDTAFRFGRATLAVVAALVGAPAHAGDHKLVVSAVILARDTCQITSDQAGLAFKADASSPVLAAASMNASLQCSGTARATTVRIHVDGGVSGSGVTGLPYRLEVPAAARVARGVPGVLKVGAVTTAGALRKAAPEKHQDTVVLTIEP